MIPATGADSGLTPSFFIGHWNKPEEGRSVLKRALWVDPMSPSARFTDAEFSLLESGAKVSEQKTLQVLELDPNFVPALHRYGQYRWLIDGKLAEAIQIIEHAIALDPKNSLLLHRAMAVYLDLGDVKAARAVVAGLPPRAQVKWGCSRCTKATGDVRASRHTMRRVGPVTADDIAKSGRAKRCATMR